MKEKEKGKDKESQIPKRIAHKKAVIITRTRTTIRKSARGRKHDGSETFRAGKRKPSEEIDLTSGFNERKEARTKSPGKLSSIVPTDNGSVLEISQGEKIRQVTDTSNILSNAEILPSENDENVNPVMVDNFVPKNDTILHNPDLTVSEVQIEVTDNISGQNSSSNCIDLMVGQVENSLTEKKDKTVLPKVQKHNSPENESGHEIEVWETGETLYTKLKKLTDIFGKTAQCNSQNVPQNSPAVARLPTGDHSYCTANTNPYVSPTNAKDLERERNYSEENHEILLSLVSKLETIKTTVDSNADSIHDLTGRIARVENKVDNSLLEVHERINLEENNLIELGEQVQSNEITLRRYTDDQVCALKQELLPIIGGSQENLELRVKNQENKLYEKMDAKVSSLINSDLVMGKLDNLVESQINTKLKDTNSRILQFGSKLNASEANFATVKSDLGDLLNQCKQERATVNSKIKELEKTIIELKKSILNYSQVPTEPAQTGGKFSIPNNGARTEDLGARFEHLAKRIDFIEHKTEQTGKLAQNLDMKSRRNNLVIDQLTEESNENLLNKLNEILDHAMADNNQGARAEILISRAYRLGAVREGAKFIRKVFVELANARSKDLIIEYAARIVKTGNNGRPFYINDDMPESLKRHKADIHKYMNYLKSRKHVVEKAGDDLIIDGRRWRYDELNDLPEGDKLMNSRTLCFNGIVAFQSWLSPLSNLYPCQIRANGFEYTSVEQGYQHAKAIHHRNFALARRILLENDPYEIMLIAKHHREDFAWATRKFIVLETLVKHKAEQVPLFLDLLKRTGNHRLIENSWDHFWGTGCPFAANCVWYGGFRGQNHFGRLLEKVRSEV